MAVTWVATGVVAPLLLIAPWSVNQGIAADPIDWSGNVALEERGFASDGGQPGQDRYGISLSGELEYYQAIGPHSITVTPFGRVDSADAKRTHGDLREAYLLWVGHHFELAVGARRVFWGVTESQHLVDIINQTDLVENTDTEDKLGQPMVQLLVPVGQGALELFAMPYFRERTFPGRRGRIRTPIPVAVDQATYESGAEEWHPDFAARYSQYWGPWDLGFSHFSGTSREPTLVPVVTGMGGVALAPFYPQIEQSGLDVQLTVGQWLLKGEAIHRIGQGRAYTAWTTGYEYTFVGIFGSRIDLGVLGEWLRDTRGNTGATPFAQDVMTGFRLAFNDVEDTQILVAAIVDVDHGGTVAFLEGARRIAESLTLEVEIRLFDAPAQDALVGSFDRDDHIQVNLARYF